MIVTLLGAFFILVFLKEFKKKFEKIVCAGLLEFVNSSEKVLKNIRKHSKKNCRLVILCPGDNLLAKFYKLYHSTNKINIKLFINLITSI